ncbi:MAG: methyltransferase domain-containing protein [Hormoscilla sp. GM7CHS1pb]|nr:methyltransferase domain-containing protein [Hormoscilla sp. GM7CHS1pb]
MTKSKFTEAETEAFYDAEDSLYRSFWDSEGSLHWGYFEEETQASAAEFIPACQRWNEYMLSLSGIDASSRVLDIGCGNGNTAIWLAQQRGCSVVGIDISQVRIDNARAKARENPELQLEFEKESVTNLPFAEGEFTHVWSQATIYHVHDRYRGLQEIHRVLKEGGILIFDDLVTPVKEITEQGRKYVYDRLLFEPTYSQSEYIDVLSQLGLMVLESEDLSEHLHKSYESLSQLAKPQYPELSAAYEKMCEAIAVKELGWSFFVGEKVRDRLSWIYETKDTQKLQSRYDAWSRIYDAELDRPYRISPIKSARALAKVLSDKEASILDAGAGTGMVGEALGELGYSKITAIDLSSEMLEVARKKGVYQALYQGKLEAEIKGCPPNSFGAIIAVGVFTFGHASPEGLRNLNTMLKSGGYFVLTVRVDYQENNAVLHQVMSELPWSLISREEFTIFETEPMYAMVFQKK